MKKLLAFAALFAVVALTSCKYDDDDLWNSVHGLENRVAKLEELCKQMNSILEGFFNHNPNRFYLSTSLFDDLNQSFGCLTICKEIVNDQNLI